MNIKRLPLAERFERMANGRVAHPEYNASAIQTMAHTLIAVYLHDFEPERARVMELIGPWGATDNMTYQEIAAFVRDLRRTPDGVQIAAEVADHLAAPLLRCYRERMTDYGSPIDQIAAG